MSIAKEWPKTETYVIPQLHTLVPDSWDRYIEPYFGTGGLLFSLPPVICEAVNDCTHAVANLYTIIGEMWTYRDFRDKAKGKPNSLRVVMDSFRLWWSDCYPVDKVVHWWVIARQRLNTPVARNEHSIELDEDKLAHLREIEGLDRIHARLRRTHVEHDAPWRVIRKYALPTAFIYCAPQVGDWCYPPEHRQKLVEEVRETPARIMIADLEPDPYYALESTGWNMTEVRISNGETVYVWRNYRRSDTMFSLPHQWDSGKSSAIG